MAITFRATTSATTASAATSITVNVPGSVVDGDVMLLCCVNSDSSDPADFNDPSGWTTPRLVNNLQTGGSAPSAPGMSVWWRVASSEPASYNITTNPSAANGLIAYIIAFSGVDQTTPIDVATTTATGDSTNADPPSITTTTDAARTVIAAWWDANTARGSSAPSGYTDSGAGEIIGLGGGNGCTSRLCYRSTDVSPAGAENPANFGSTAEQWGTFTIALRPAVTEGITSVDTAYGIDSGELDYDDTDVDINGLNFETPIGSGAVYLSDADTLAGSVNEVDISSTVNTWADALVNLDFSQLSAGEVTSLDTLGPGTRYIILTNNSADEYASSAITLHRPKAFGLSLSTQFAQNAVTTAQLTAPLGKTTGDFGGGKMIESANPGTTTDPGADEYTEDEMCFEALPNSVEDETYQFRVLIGGVVADTITVTPELTISSISVPNITNAGDELFEPDELNVVITGTNFGATETGSAKVELVNNVVYASGTKVTQSIDTWAATSIQFDVTIGALTEVDLWLYVTDTIGTVSVGYPVQIIQVPVISNVGSGTIANNEQGVILNGTGFEDVVGTGKLELSDSGTYGGTLVTQTVTTWGKTQLIFNVVKGGFDQGTHYFYVTNDVGGVSLGFSVTLTAPPPEALYQQGSFQTVITNTGLLTTIFLISDEE